jgi:hypothetical protein
MGRSTPHIAVLKSRVFLNHEKTHCYIAPYRHWHSFRMRQRHKPAAPVPTEVQIGPFMQNDQNMNPLQFRGVWNIGKGKLNQKWVSLTVDDLKYPDARTEATVRRITLRTGFVCHQRVLFFL